MKDRILKIINDEKYRRQSVHGFQNLLEIESSGDFKQLIKTLNILEEECILARDNSDRYDIAEKLNFFKGKLILKEKGFGFIEVENKEQDIFIPKDKINGALNKDVVFVKEKKRKSDSRRSEGEVIKIIERGTSFLIGEYFEKSGVGFIKPHDKTMKLDILVNKNNALKAMKNHIVKATIIKYINKTKVEAKITEIIGHKNDPGVDILAIVHNFDHPTVFTEEVIEAANNVDEVIKDTDLLNRKDLRKRQIVTIDGDDAKDLDDAISVEKLGNGKYKLGVYIADVSHYVKEGSTLDIEAYKRGTSVYLADRVIPMIPHRLSNGICSLNPYEDRLVMCCDMTIDSNGNVVDHEIYEGVINSKARMTYNNVNKILAKDPKLMEEYKDFIDLFDDMDKLAKILNKRREKRGSINFETTESKIVVDKSGKPIDIILRSRGTSEKIIEEFMLCANETVAEHMHWLKYPFIYRIHEDPKSDKLEKFISLVRLFGHNIKGTSNKVHQLELQKLLDDVAGTPEERPLNTLLLRSMMKAKYSESSLGHYGLAAEFYTHFTSPIRRYPDLIVHRLLREYLIKGNITARNLERRAILMPQIGLHTSKKERDAVDCERQVSDMKKAEYMEDYVGEEYVGVISSITNFGMFIELENSVEGLIHIMDMDDDYYEFHEDKMIMLGRRKAKIFRLGDSIKIKVKSASKEEKEVNFEFIKVEKTNANYKPRKYKDKKHQQSGKSKKNFNNKKNHKNKSKKRNNKNKTFS